MKMYFLLWLSRSLMLVVVLGAVIAFAGPLDSKVRMGVLSNNPPWIYEENGQVKGIAVERHKQLFDRLNVDSVQVPYDNYPRLLQNLSQGQIDVTPAYVGEGEPLPQHYTFVCASTPYISDSAGVFALASSNIEPVNDLSELAEFRIGINRSANIEQRKLDKKTFVAHHNPDQLYKLLLGKRVDVIVMSEGTIKYWSEEYGTEFTKVLTLNKFYAHMCCSNTSLGEDQATQLCGSLGEMPEQPDVSPDTQPLSKLE